MDISYSNYRKMHRFIREDIREELEVFFSLESDEKHYAYMHARERIIGRLLGKGYALGVSSGTTALQFALTSLGIGEGDEVITVPNTYIATLLAISNVGARPVLVDVEPETLLIDAGKITHAISQRTKAIVPVHLFGQMADMNAIGEISAKHSLSIIEDAAQSHFATQRGKSPGTASDAACYSFYINKNFGGAGNGGLLITKSRKVRDMVEILRNPDADDPLLLKSLRTPAYLDWIHLAILSAKMKHVRKWTRRRREIAKRYEEGLQGLPLILPAEKKKNLHVYRDYAVRCASRDALKRHLEKRGVETAIHYPLPLHLTKTFRSLGYSKRSFPIAEEASSRLLSLPVNSFLTDSETDHVIRSVRSFFIK